MIGVFDSGLGGLSVLAALTDALPRSDFVYFADSANVPYGNKPNAFIQDRALAIGGDLTKRGCRMLVVACNTATAASVQALREAHPGIPVIGVEPGIKPAAQTTVSRKIAVLVTESTARSERLAQLIREHANHISVHVEACPGWATQVETLKLHDPRLIDDVSKRLEPLLSNGVDRIVLGCTHYSFLRPILETVIAGRAEIIDVAAAVARQTQRLAGNATLGKGHLTMLASADVECLFAALPALGLQHLTLKCGL